jgi:uncharacterized protein (DUF885 family)
MLVLTVMLAANANVQSLVEDYLQQSYKDSPTTASLVGHHKDGVDRKLDDVSPAARTKRIAYLQGVQKKIAGLDIQAATPDDRADARLIQENVALELLSLEQAKDFSRRPDSYVGSLGSTFFAMISREYAPLDTRAQDVAARLSAVPRYLDQARKNLAVYVDAFHDAALDDGKGLAEFLRDDLPKAFEKSAKKGEIAKALPVALKAIDAYLKFVEGPYTKLPKGDWRYGRALYDQRFPHYLQTDLSPDEVLRRAEEQITKVRAEMAKLAKPLYKGPQGKSDDQIVRAVLDAIGEEHSTPEGMFGDAKADVARERAFIEKKHLLTLPPAENLQIVETPPFMRSSYGVAGFDGAPPLQPQLGAFFYVTPFPKDWSSEQIQSKLREYNKWNMEILSIHEAMPGHFVQFQYANQVKPEYRRVARWLLSSNAYAEGWGVFAQELMVEAGYLDANPKLRLSEMKSVLRVLANTVLDIRLQSRNMTEAEAMKLMTETTFQEKSEAEQKMKRARLDVTQLCSYFVGLEEWRGIREAVKQKEGKAFDQRAFLDRALSYGGVALPSLRQLMLGGSGSGARSPSSP